MKAIICILATLITSTALAYKDGTYNCKIADGTVPDRVIKIETIDVSGKKIPYIEVTRYYKEGTGFKEIEVKGFASQHIDGAKEILMLAALRFDFENDEMQNCRK